jgi:hypothetical protein
VWYVWYREQGHDSIVVRIRQPERLDPVSITSLLVGGEIEPPHYDSSNLNASWEL